MPNLKLWVILWVLKQNQPSQSLVKGWLSRAGGRTRTADQLITNQLLYRLSYTGWFCGCKNRTFSYCRNTGAEFCFNQVVNPAASHACNFLYFCPAFACFKRTLTATYKQLTDNMSFRIIVLAKQVPDTRNVGKDAMKADGTVNRAALPAIFNPEDLHALEMALQFKDRIPGAEIVVLSMGPSRAAEIIREAMYRGADRGFLVTDRKFAGSDTLATSYALALAVKKLEPYHVLIAGRQAIDGDTAQVGPQTAEKLGIPQVTYAEELVAVDKKHVTIKRRLERGIETVKSPLPVCITVHSSAEPCRPRNAKLLMKYKHARTLTELQEETKDYTELRHDRPYLNIEEWSVDDLQADATKLGLGGSPTKVKKIDNVVLQHKDSKVLSAANSDIEWLMKELISSHVLG